MMANSFKFDPKDVKGEIILVKKIIDGYWALIGPVRPVMRLESREQAVRMAKQMWSNFILQTQYGGVVHVDDFRVSKGKTE